ncbi:hypothetical protein GN241_17325 [Rhodobacteraceae bacterium IMCC1335]
MKSHTIDLNDMFSPVSFGGGGGGGGATQAGIGVANTIAGEMDCSPCDFSDPEGVFGRPTFDEGDAYSGDKTYGDADGR